MNNNQKLLQHLLAGLDDNELQDLSSAVYLERETRLQTKIVAGNYPVPVPAELLLWNDGNKLKAIQSYKARAKDVDIRTAKRVFENFFQLHQFHAHAG